MLYEMRIYECVPFATDPGWLAARAKTEESGPIVARVRNTFMRPTDYSPTP
jgi:hypothetical protein